MNALSASHILRASHQTFVRQLVDEIHVHVCVRVCYTGLHKRGDVIEFDYVLPSSAEQPVGVAFAGTVGFEEGQNVLSHFQHLLQCFRYMYMYMCRYSIHVYTYMYMYSRDGVLKGHVTMSVYHTVR